MQIKADILYRAILVILALETVFYYVRMNVGVDIPDEAIRYNEWFASYQMGAGYMFGLSCFVLGEVLSLISVLGMFFYFSKARYSFLASLVLYLISASLIPVPVLIDNVESAMTGLVAIMSGIVLAMSFLPPVSAKFNT